MKEIQKTGFVGNNGKEYDSPIGALVADQEHILDLAFEHSGMYWYDYGMKDTAKALVDLGYEIVKVKPA